MRHLALSGLVGPVSTLAVAAFASGGVLAQPATESSAAVVLEEIVVTALRREQRLQDVPAAITVLDGDTLASKGGQDYRDYLTSIPGVSFAESGLRAVRVTIRGVSDGIGATDPLTGIYIDETPITESFQATLDPSVHDLDRVEVLKGPQGTLYGSGSMGGTVRVITKKPRLDAFEGTAEATVGGVSGGGVNRRVDGVLNVPLAEDRVALRISGGYRKDAGWIDDIQRADDDGNTVEKTNGRAQLLLKPGENTSMIFGVLYQEEELGIPFFDDLALPDYQTARVYRQSGGSEARLYSATIQHDSDWMSLISASNYLVKDTINSTDSTTTARGLLAALAGVALSPTEGVGVESGNDLNLFTQEVRVSSVGENRLDWVVGGFYSNAVTDFTTLFDFSQAPSTAGLITGAAFYDAKQEYRTRQIAAFGEITLNVTEQLSLTAGLRAFDVDQRNALRGDGILNGGSTATLQEASNSSTTKKFLAKYQVTDDNMLYAQASQGYRNGGPTGGFPLAACAPHLAAVGYSTVPTQYGPDELWNYEVGSKNTFLDGRMAFNAAAFYIDWSDIQSTIGLACGFSFIDNAGEAVSKGAEMEASVMPIAGLTFTAAAAYTSAKIDQAAPGTAAGDGDPLPLSPEWSWNFSTHYQRDLTNHLTGFVRGEVNHVGERWNMFRSIAARGQELDAYTTFNLRIGVAAKTWSAALFGTNLTNERIVTWAPGINYEIVAMPRVVGLNVKFEY